MLTIAKEHINVGERRNGEPPKGPVNPGADVHLFGQEVNPETWAIAKSGCPGNRARHRADAGGGNGGG
jgi:type I restriction-modification system DNA methylase subunit